MRRAIIILITTTTLAAAAAASEQAEPPARATAAYGRAVEMWWVNGFADLIVRTLQGENMLEHPRTPDAIPAAIAPVLEGELAEEQAFQMKLDDWLARRRQR